MEHRFYRFNDVKPRCKIGSILLAAALAFSTLAISSPLGNGLTAPSVAYAQTTKQLTLAPELKTVPNSGPAPPASNFNLPPGYTIEPVAWNLTLPGPMTADDKGNLYLAIVGYAYGQIKSTPMIVKIDPSGNTTILVDRFLFEPISDIKFNKNNGLIYVSHRAIISTVDPNTGVVKDLVVGLPQVDSGSHPQGQIAFGPDGRVYFTTGTATNSGVVDKSDLAFGWLKVMPQMHDIPGQDVTLTGQNFESKDLLHPQNQANATTGAFVPFGTSTSPGQMIKGNATCTGCLLSINPDGSDLRLHAWGLRSPFGMALDGDNNKLYITNNGADDKGIRPITNDTDNVYTFDLNSVSTATSTTTTSNRTSSNATSTSATGANSSSNLIWYGWPDFFGNGEPVTDAKFGMSKNLARPHQFLIQNHPQVTMPFTELGVGPGVTQLAYINSTAFIQTPSILSGEFGIAVPINHDIRVNGRIIGQKIVSINPMDGNVTDFLSLKEPDNSFRPVALAFNEQENALYISSIGKVEIRTTTDKGGNLPMPVVWPYPLTGVIWKVTYTGGTTAASAGSAG
jgi:glucose/arabinose dehydrogenase